jgi:hypothetical protein
MAEESRRTRAQESRAAIERLYIIMRHLFIRGSYKPLGISGESLMEALLTLSPEIYGSISDASKTEIEGLAYVIDRLPVGIEECRYIRLISIEGLEDSGYEVIIPSKRRRNCYRVDEEQMYVELTRGRSDIYDILTHLTFLYIEANKIRRNSIDHKGNTTRDWKMLEKLVLAEEKGHEIPLNKGFTYLSNVIGRTYEETKEGHAKFGKESERNSLFHIVYYMGKLAIEEEKMGLDREITFSNALRERVGHHLYGEQWADNIKNFLHKHGLLDKDIHIISANLHSVMNIIYAKAALGKTGSKKSLLDVALELSKDQSGKKRKKVSDYAKNHGLYEMDQTSGTNLVVQIINTGEIDTDILPEEVNWNKKYLKKKQPVIIVMDYAFGEQAYEAMDELLKPYQIKEGNFPLKVQSISIMGKAGILDGNKGDIMVPTAHIFEGTADNYPLDNQFNKSDFEGNGLKVCQGSMITVLGTSLQNRDILKYFRNSSWNTVGLEMEGAHYQKAIQSASRIRKSISEQVKLYYAYYASDNPLVTGKTLSSGSLGVDGVKPTYLITSRILSKTLGS